MTETPPARYTAGNAWCALHPWLPWAAPFVAYVLILSARDYLPLDATGNHILRLIVCGTILALCSRKLFSLRMVNPLGSVVVGILVFLIWVAPDALFPGYRAHWLFSNSLLGAYDPAANASMASATAYFLLLRIAVSVALVPILEELFWRGFLLRLVIRSDFEKIPLGTWHLGAFWIVAVLFALEHGSYWDVGLAAGLIYNGWMVRTKSLGDLIWAHAITNGLLAAYVILLGKWQFWP